LDSGATDKLLLTPKEATELLGISRSKLYELLRAGTIESVKIGDCRRVPRAALDEYVDRLRREAVA
jgi:excisionase family DNA binding protein